MGRLSWLPLAAMVFIVATPLQAETLHAALESAWQKQPAQRTQSARTAELEAKLRATDALTPEPGSVTIGHRTDRIGSNLGRRELEIELAAPLWLAGQRGRQRDVVNAETAALTAAQVLAKWRLAAEVRDAAWQARIAEAERALAHERVESAARLAADVIRRVNAGDLARVDANRAKAEQQSAQIAAGEIDSRAFRAMQLFTALTGLGSLPSTDEPAMLQPAQPHPQMGAAQQQATLARQRLAYTGATRRDPPEVSVALARERGSFDERPSSSIMLRLKIPFATDARNQPKMAAAQVEREEAEAMESLEATRIDTEIISVRRELQQANDSMQLSLARAELTRDTHLLLERAFKLGELDLATRLRGEAERFEAERTLIRAQMEAGHAISKLNQALGHLP